MQKSVQTNVTRPLVARRLLPLALAGILCVPLLALPSSSPAFASPTDKGKKSKETPPPPYTGVKHRIAAVNIRDAVVYTTVAGSVRLPATFGNSLLDMLTTGLVNSGHFTVFERAQLSDVKDEIDLGGSGLIDPATAVKLGKLKSIEYIITGSITEYAMKKGGGGLRVGGVLVGGAGDKATLTVDLRIIDTTTGQILNTVTGSGDSSATGGGISYVGPNIGIGGAAMQDASLSKAARNAMNDAVQKLCDQIEQAETGKPVVQWEGEVLDADVVGGKLSTVSIKGGANAGLKLGDEIEILLPGKELKDKSGEVLGRKPDKHIARCRITEVQEKLITATFIEAGSFQAEDAKNYVAHRVGGS